MRAERLLSLALASLLAGCHAVGPKPRHVPDEGPAGAVAGPVARAPDGEALALLAWFETVRGLGPQARARLAGELRARTEPGRCSAERVRLAILWLAEGGEPAARRARHTVEPCVVPGDEGGAGVRLVAVVVARLADARAGEAAARHELQAARVRTRTLERQLEALKAIERSIRARGRADGGAGEGEKDGTGTRPARR